MTTLAKRVLGSSRILGRFTLRSGAVSDTYFDKYQFEADPALLREIATELAALLPPGTEVLAGLELGGIPIATVLSQVTGLPTAFIRKQAKSYGTCRYAEGASLEGKRFALIEDVVSSGGALVEAIAKLQADGLSPVAAMCVIDRRPASTAPLSVPLLALFTRTEIEEA